MAWWSASYLRFWGFSLTSNGQTLVQRDEDPFDQSIQLNACIWVDCFFDVNEGVWRMLVSVQELTLIYDDFYQNFNHSALAFGFEQKNGLENLIDIINAKMEVEIGGAEITLVGHEDDFDLTEVFWQDLLMRIVLHDNFCAISNNNACTTVEDVTRVDMIVERKIEGNYFSGTCKSNIDYTSGEYELSGSNGVLLTGYTLERGGPDSDTPAFNSDVCTNTPKRIPAGSYNFTVGSTRRYTNIPIIDSSSFGRTGILVHNSAGAYGTIGCILVGKTSSASGVFAGNASQSSLQALNEISQALTYSTSGADKFLFKYGVLTVENNIN
ncbi:DUF5675 family protein [Marinibactrum halimedae]|uniref:DUF5675 domain-containing protein n=1 Tax=Marinibactrum halimedae TaxID=1444977 RepID=A0AA37WMC3_9GAMM|nr:DUF5675 family protein [Marinibactrum halimedae]MCD9458202.1 DUF5675 family protein [Marinibactrum halimedae]GLS27169.1 hypothetical protein GCM10007877_28880 [Marinibactrum halimedae]